MKSSNCIITDILINDLASPLGVTPERVIISWKTVSERDGFLQTAYRAVISDGEKTVWDSGKTEDGVSVGITACGLEAMTEYSLSVTVWGNGGEEITGRSSFETGLHVSNPFGNAKWISYDAPVLYTGTRYSIDFDFIIEQGAQAFCFSLKDNDNLIMWQVNNSLGERVILRPHVREDGEWCGFKGGRYDLPEFDVTDAVGCTSSELFGKRIHERIEVNGREVKTYFGKDASSLTLGAVYDHFTELPLINFGFCQSWSDPNEVSLYGNIVICDGDGKMIYEKDFTDGETAFTNSYRMTVFGDMARVSDKGADRVLVCARTDNGNMPVFRREIELGRTPVSARLYTSGLGVYEAYVNGGRVCRIKEDGSREYDELKPGFTECGERRFYNTYDVTEFLTRGKNVLSAVVTHGWWSDKVTDFYGKEDAFIAKLIVKYSDGTMETFDTDTSWRSEKVSPVVYADIFTGETYDARVNEDYKYVGFDDSEWKYAKVNTEFGGVICPYMGSRVISRKDLTRTPQNITVYSGAVGARDDRYGKINTVRRIDGKFTLSPGETALVDFGQNFAGCEGFIISAPRGTYITVKHGEMLNDSEGLISRGNDGPEGSVYNENYRMAVAATKYIARGALTEEYTPIFSFYGFRYIEITADRDITVHSVWGRVITSVEKDTGFIETSDKDVNQLISNIRWGQYSNYLSVPTDCPQRDERQGWLADTQVFTRAGCYLGFSKSFLTKYTVDMCDCQDEQGLYPSTAPTGSFNGGIWGAMGWADAGIIIPRVLYSHYGDKNVIIDNWNYMQKYVDVFLSKTEKKGPFGFFGDWLAYEANDDGVKDILSVAYYAWTL